MATAKKEKEDTLTKEAEELGNQLGKVIANDDSSDAFNNYYAGDISFEQAKKTIIEDWGQLDHIKTKLMTMAMKTGATDAFFLMSYLEIRDRLKESHDTYRELLRLAHDNGDWTS